MIMKTKNEKRIALVTGGGSGIGLAIATKFVNEGIFTIISGRDKSKLQQAKEAIGELCEYIICDLNELKSIPAMITKILDQYGSIDILVNNAGINMKKDFIDVTDEDFQQIILTNLTATFVLSRETAKSMIEKGSGCIINISSMASQYGIPKVTAYTASKSAIEGITRSMAVDLSPKGIRVNCIAPGFIATDMSAKALNNDPERKQKVLSRTPMGHLGMPADVADAAYFLSSDAAKYVTGVVLPIDGGNSIGF